MCNNRYHYRRVYKHQDEIEAEVVPQSETMACDRNILEELAKLQRVEIVLFVILAVITTVVLYVLYNKWKDRMKTKGARQAAVLALKRSAENVLEAGE